MTTIERIGTTTRISGAVVHNGTVYLAGQTATDRSKDIRGQTAEVLSKIDQLLAEAGTDKSRLLSVQIWMKDVAQWGAMNDVWDLWTATDAAPARATSQCEMASADILVEMIVIAAEATR